MNVEEGGYMYLQGFYMALQMMDPNDLHRPRLEQNMIDSDMEGEPRIENRQLLERP